MHVSMAPPAGTDIASIRVNVWQDPQVSVYATQLLAIGL